MIIDYPLSPKDIDVKKLQPSPEFKNQVWKVMTSIILFIVTYLILVAASVALAVGCFYLGGFVIISRLSFVTLMIGLGLMAVGVSVVVFVIKFIFSVNRSTDESRIEILEGDQPKLFEFIRELTKETKTPFPKKIFLSGDVNACVFYNSSFWSMFLPVRKNLQIGLGLVNTVNLSEFKAIMAHEFGHFSQRSMKLGSFTYNVNQIIYNMLYNNNSYNEFLSSWAKINGYFSFFALVTVKIAGSIQLVLKEMYKIINKSYMSLSREMEFHADAVAASVSGSNNMISALARVEVSASCYSGTLKSADECLKNKKVLSNLYSGQLVVLNRFAIDNQLPVKHGLPEISTSFINSFSNSRVNYKDQWSSHPPLAEREEHLKKLGFYAEADTKAAWCIFDNAEKLQAEMTNNIYKNVASGEEEKLDARGFESYYLKSIEDLSFPEAYNGYYDGRMVDVKDWNIDEVSSEEVHMNFDDLFSRSNSQLQTLITQNERDIALLKEIMAKNIDVRNFDFDGKKYARKDCAEIIENLETENEGLKTKLQALDKQAFAYFCKVTNREKLKAMYSEFKDMNSRSDNFIKKANAVFDILNVFYVGGLTVEEAGRKVSILKDEEEVIKKAFEKLIAERVVDNDSNRELLKGMKAFIDSNYVYFSGESFLNGDLQGLSDIIIAVANYLAEQKYKYYKSLLEYQLSMNKPEIGVENEMMVLN